MRIASRAEAATAPVRRHRRIVPADQSDDRDERDASKIKQADERN